jgi:hypothetical protein
MGDIAFPARGFAIQEIPVDNSSGGLPGLVWLSFDPASMRCGERQPDHGDRDHG